MIPLKDNIPSDKHPIVTYLLILINIGVFLYEVSLGNTVDNFIITYGIIPGRDFFPLLLYDWFELPSFLYRSVTSMFIHGGWIHIIGNILYLWLFGDNVEDRLGHFRFVLFYLLSGIVASIAECYVHPYSDIPVVGASGAISGVIGAYIFFYPYAKIIMMVPLFFFYPYFFELPALLFVIFWFIEQLLNGLFELSVILRQGGVAWWAHIGGFITGLVLTFILKPKRRRERFPDEYLPW